MSFYKDLGYAKCSLSRCDRDRNQLKAHYSTRSLASVARFNIIVDEPQLAHAIIEEGKLGYNSRAVVNAKDSLSPFLVPELLLASLHCVGGDIVVA